MGPRFRDPASRLPLAAGVISRNLGPVIFQALYRVVQLNFTPEIEVFYMLFERSLSIFNMTSLKQHT